LPRRRAARDHGRVPADGRPTAVLLDAYGTLVELRPPVPRLRAALAGEGYDHDEATVAAALAAEIAHYRAHHDEGADAASLARLRRDCAAVLGAALGGAHPPLWRLTEILVEGLEFALTPDAREATDALAAAGHRLGVVSNWDCSLPAELARLGVADRFGVVAASATVGASKPAPAIFAHALRALGVAPERAVHCGDSPSADCEGALGAGVHPVLLDRAGRHLDAPFTRIPSLVDLPEAAAGALGRRPAASV
jgi:putative hydrolase of the HAD superfamily